MNAILKKNYAKTLKDGETHVVIFHKLLLLKNKKLVEF